MLKQRFLVAALFLPVFAWLVFRPEPGPFFGLCLASLGIAVIEMSGMVGRRFTFHLAVALPAVLAIGVVAGFPGLLPPAWGMTLGSWLWAVLVAAVLILGFWIIVSGDPERGFPSMVYTLFAILMLGGMGSFFLLLRRLPRGDWWITLLVGFSWMYDAGALLFGMWLGRTRLAPGISPAKTVEGLAGGLATNLACALALYFTLLPKELNFSLPGFLGWSLLAGVLAQAGDLVESSIKRWSGLKDSAGFIPGHGGILDKLDSLFFNAPVLYLIARLIA